jgi:hypothetical protein
LAGLEFTGGLMQRRVIAIVLFACFALAAVALAQEGHPLTGTWAGDWGPSATERNHITFVMNWDGKNVTGIINPGPDAVPIASVFLDVTNWTIRIQADAKDQAGNPVRIAAEGRLEDLSSPHRSIRGAWTQGGAKGDFVLTRD